MRIIEHIGRVSRRNWVFIFKYYFPSPPKCRSWPQIRSSLCYATEMIQETPRTKHLFPDTFNANHKFISMMAMS